MEHGLPVYNPKSGRVGLKEDFLGRIVQELTEDGTIVTVYQTQRRCQRIYKKGKNSI